MYIHADPNRSHANWMALKRTGSSEADQQRIEGTAVEAPKPTNKNKQRNTRQNTTQNSTSKMHQQNDKTKPQKRGNIQFMRAKTTKGKETPPKRSKASNEQANPTNPLHTRVRRHKGHPATDVVFPQCLGIYICSSTLERSEFGMEGEERGLWWVYGIFEHRHQNKDLIFFRFFHEVWFILM